MTPRKAIKQYAIGPRNGMARDPDSVVELARRLHKSGLGYRRIAQRMSEQVRPIHVTTVRQWVTGATRSAVKGG